LSRYNTGARRDGEILCWDVRHTSDVVYRCARASHVTNQRIGFDIEPCGRHLVSGGSDGCLRAYDLANGEEVGAWQAGGDTISDWAFHPSASFVPPGEGSVVGSVPRGASVSGHRHFRSPADGDDDEDDEDGGEGRGKGGANNKGIVDGEAGGPTNALRIWDYSCSVIPVG
jgi:WD40 repeat protein